MTRPQIRAYWHYMNRRKLKELELQATLMFGYNPRQRERAQKQKQMAERWLVDPLYGFPNDIIYFTPEQIKQKMDASKRFWKRMLPEARWDGERGQACLGHFGTVARRCSMNDKLWKIYLDAKCKSLELTLGQIKKMILIDIKRSKLYPPGWTDDVASPPEWYLEKLRSDGSLDWILREIDEAVRA